MAEPAWLIAHPGPDDCDELGAVHLAVWREAYAGIMDDAYLASLDDDRFVGRWRTITADPESAARTLVARDAHGRVVGFVSSGPSRDDDAPTEWELYAINLLARVHGTGLADLLLRRSLGDRPATLWVAADNARAVAFYRRHGFEDEGTRKDHDGSGAPEVRMIRRRPVRPAAEHASAGRPRSRS